MRTFWRLLGFLRPYRAGVIASFVLAAAAIGATVLIPFLTGRAIDAIRSGDRGELERLGLVILGAGVLRLALTVGRRLIAGPVSLGVEVDLRNQLYARLQALEVGFFDGQQTGQLMSRATVDLQSVRFFLGYGLIFVGQAVLTILLAAVAMLFLDPVLALLALAPVPSVIFVARRYSQLSRPALQEVQQRIAELTAEAEENVSGVRVVKAFAREERQLHRFRRTVKGVFDQSMISTRLRAFYTPFMGFLPNIGLAAILFYGGRQVVEGSLSLGDFAAFYTYLLMLISPMRTIGFMLGSAQRATASGARIFELLDREPRIVAPEGAPPLPPGDGRIELRGVTLTFEGGRSAALRDVDLVAEGGKVVALIGPTGSGKTTLTSLVPRLYDPEEGTVLVDGVDVREVDLGSLRSQVALVTDDPFLFSVSVADNIAYGRPEATREEVEAAARRAQAAGFVEELPEGYDTLIGERGLTLSGGQRQRVAIARALLADPRILILDDATSSVDASTEREIKDALTAAMAGRTTLVIAHRLSTISLADEIVELDHGQIVARGTHAELLGRDGLYREIFEKGLPDQIAPVEKPAEPEVAGL
ncbi:MAG: ABC transporter ATP-binding protein [Solirubrobacteraceae bacterium]